MSAPSVVLLFRLRAGTLNNQDDFGAAPIGGFEPSVAPREVLLRFRVRGGRRA